MSRQLLANTSRQSFTGIISAFGKTPDGQSATALKDIENHSGKIVADPSEYQHFNNDDKNYLIRPQGLTFQARNVPKELTPKFRRRLLKHKNQYFAGIVLKHSIRFIGQGDDGTLRLTLRNAYFVESIVTPHTFEQPIIVFKAIVYKNTPFLGMLAK